LGCELGWVQGTMHEMGSSPIQRGNFEGQKGRHIVKYRDSRAVQNGCTDRDVLWDTDSGGSKEACV